MTNYTETKDAAATNATAYAMRPGDFFYGQISSAGERDRIAIQLTAGKTYTFAMAGKTSSKSNLSDGMLMLFDANGNQVGYDDDGGPGRNPSITFTCSASGTYYIDAMGFESIIGDYILSATQGSKANYNADMGAAILLRSQTSWASSSATPVVVTYGFRSSASNYITGHDTENTFSRLSAAEIAACRLALASWSDVCGVRFQEVSDSDGYTNNATILFSNYSNTTDGAGAFAYHPGSAAAASNAGDVYLNLSGGISTTSNPFGSFSYFAIMHELGHAIGLDHPSDYNGGAPTYANNAQSIQDSQQYTIMSYFGAAASGGNFNGARNDTIALYDVLAAQTLYGVNTTTRTGDTRYGWNSNAGAVYDFSTNARPVFCIWDAGGNDSLDCSQYSMRQTIDLRAGYYSNESLNQR